jgi:hypothetical protein
MAICITEDNVLTTMQQKKEEKEAAEAAKVQRRLDKALKRKQKEDECQKRKGKKAKEKKEKKQPGRKAKSIIGAFQKLQVSDDVGSSTELQDEVLTKCPVCHGTEEDEDEGYCEKCGVSQ